MRCKTRNQPFQSAKWHTDPIDPSHSKSSFVSEANQSTSRRVTERLRELWLGQLPRVLWKDIQWFKCWNHMVSAMFRCSSTVFPLPTGFWTGWDNFWKKFHSGSRKGCCTVFKTLQRGVLQAPERFYTSGLVFLFQEGSHRGSGKVPRRIPASFQHDFEPFVPRFQQAS